MDDKFFKNKNGKCNFTSFEKELSSIRTSRANNSMLRKYIM